MAQGGQTRGKDAPLVKCSVITIRQAPKAKEYSKHMLHAVSICYTRNRNYANFRRNEKS